MYDLIIITTHREPPVNLLCHPLRDDQTPEPASIQGQVDTPPFLVQWPREILVNLSLPRYTSTRDWSGAKDWTEYSEYISVCVCGVWGGGIQINSSPKQQGT